MITQNLTSDARSERKRPPPRLVVFDAVGTLLHVRGSVAEAYARAAREHGIEADDARLRAAIAEAWGRFFPAATSGVDGLNITRPTGEEDQNRRWRGFVEYCLSSASVQRVRPERLAAAFDTLWHHFASPGAWELDPAAGKALSAIERAGVRWVIASNFDSRLRGVAGGFAEFRGCEAVFDSAGVGYEKPDALFYTAVERRCGVAGGEVCMAGDSRVLDCLAPLRLGWRAVWIAGEGAEGERAREVTAAGGQVVRSLAELPEAILG